MNDPLHIFDRTRAEYLERLAGKDLTEAETILGAKPTPGGLRVPFLNTWFEFGPDGFADADGARASFETCVLLSQYLLLMPAHPLPPARVSWRHYRDFPGSGPLTVYYHNQVEQPLASLMAAHRPRVPAAVLQLGGHQPDLAAAYDLAAQLPMLPRITALVLFNDADELLPAGCSVLFNDRADQFLDMESLAILGRLLFVYLEAALTAKGATAGPARPGEEPLP